MNKSIYIAFIKHYENEETKKIIGNIDVKILERKSKECLYYAFPLIEKIVLEIFKLVPDSDVEHMEQGIMRTPLSIIKSNNSHEVLPNQIIEMIEYYYGDDGPRNMLFHVNKEVKTINVNFDKIVFLISRLFAIFKHRLNKYNEIKFEDIKML